MEKNVLDALFLSVGAMKAGTTWLCERLKDHPEISFTPEKEIHYFAHQNGIFDLLSQENRVKKFFNFFEAQNGFDLQFFLKQTTEIEWYARYASATDLEDSWYQWLFSFKAPQAKYCADFCNLNSQLDASGWRHVRRNCRTLRVVYTLRDPFERAWSHFKFHMETINREEEIKDNFAYFKELCEQPWFWQFALYDEAIERLKQSLAPEELMIVYFEDFRSHETKTLNELCQFLDISPKGLAPSPTDKKVNPSLDIPIPSEFAEYLHERVSPIYHSLRRMGYGHPAWEQYKGAFGFSAERPSTTAEAA